MVKAKPDAVQSLSVADDLLLFAHAIAASVVTLGTLGVVYEINYVRWQMLVFFLLAVGAVAARRLWVRRLSSRDSVIATRRWAVGSKDLVVGELSDQELRMLKRAAVEDPRVAHRQLQVVLGSALRLTRDLIIGVPVCLFWLIALLSYTDGDAFDRFVGALAGHGTHGLMAFAIAAGYAIRWILPVLVLARVVFGKAVPTSNCYRQEIDRRVRAYLKLPPDAPVMRLYCLDEAQGTLMSAGATGE